MEDINDNFTCEYCYKDFNCDDVYYPMNENNTNTADNCGSFCRNCIGIVDPRSVIFYGLDNIKQFCKNGE